MIERNADNSLIQQETGAVDEERNRLLLLFHPDPERAQREYEQLYSRLTKMCDLRGCLRTEELISKTFQIVSRERIDEKVTLLAVRVAQRLLNELSQEDFDRLMAKLDPDPREAATKYEAIRNNLIRFFRSRRCSNPEELADRSLDRLARKLRTVDVQNLSSYARQIARFVVKEFWRAPEEIPLESEQSVDNLLPTPRRADEIIGTTSDEDEEMISALEQCLDQLDQAKRDFILAYHDTTSETEESIRSSIASRDGITMNTLRVRAFRIRQALEIRVNQQMAQHNRRSDSS